MEDLESLIIVYLLVSIVMLIVSIIVDIMFNQSFIWIAFFLLSTFIYIPIIIYYYESGNVRRAGQIVGFTILYGIAYIVIQAIFAVMAFVNK